MSTRPRSLRRASLALALLCSALGCDPQGLEGGPGSPSPDAGLDAAPEGEPEGEPEPIDGGADADPDAEAPVDEACPVDPGAATLEVERLGRLEIARGFGGGELSARDLFIHLPEGYEAGQGRYPVLYMHDGQNLFDPALAAFGAAWEVDEVVDDLSARGRIRPWIVVGIGNTGERIDEYTPDADPDFGGGRGEAYGRLVVERIKPAIDARYRTLCGANNTALAGSSLGGLISLDMFQRHPGVFGRVAAVSPSLWWNDRSMLRRLEQSAPALPARLWLDGGSAEGEQTPGGATTVIRDAARARDRALALGGEFGREVGYLEVIGAPHNEGAWAARLPSILGFLLSDEAVGELPPQEVVLTIYRPELEIGEVTDVEVGALHGGEVWLSWPAPLAGITFEPEGVVRLEGDRIVALAAGVVRVRAQIGDRSAEATLRVGQRPQVAVRFVVEAPPGTDRVHVSGSPSALGSWDGVGVALEHQGGDTWAAEVALPDQAPFEYKYTRGGWETVEKAASGQEIDNRQAVAREGATLTDTVIRWADR